MTWKTKKPDTSWPRCEWCVSVLYSTTPAISALSSGGRLIFLHRKECFNHFAHTFGAEAQIHSIKERRRA